MFYSALIRQVNQPIANVFDLIFSIESTRFFSIEIQL